MGDQLVAMKIDRENLERLFTEWPYIKGMSEFVYQLVYVSSRGETVYLLSTNGNNPFSGSDLKSRIITGSVLRQQYTYGTPAHGMFWFPVYRRT